jgi:hypothetical protein
MMRYKYWMKCLYIVTIFIGGCVVMSGCILKLLVPAPERSFASQDLLLSKEDLPTDWSVVSGPQKVNDNTKPKNSMEIALIKSIDSEISTERKWDIMERVYRFTSVEGAKEDYSVTTKFPGKTDIDGWTFTSDLADEQKVSCYTYSNMEYPVCSWVARYKEFEIEVIAWLDPNRMTLEDMQSFVMKIDEKSNNKFK